MSALLDYIEKYPKDTKRLVGIDYEQLQQLITQSEALHHQKQAKVEARKIRLNSSGAGCKPKLSLPNQVLLTLVVQKSKTYRLYRSLYAERGFAAAVTLAVH